ncbi:MAG: N-acetylmuramoyl-L-alanine amidase [Lachnospiraceae bacterium]
MRRKIELIVVLLLLIGVIAAAGKLSNYVTSDKVKAETVQVVIDPGHGGMDPGKVAGDETKEKDINLAISKKLESKLKENGISVLMTREEDSGLYDEDSSNKKAEDMKRRVEIINESKPSLVVSIHQNSYTDPSVKGAQVFYYTHSDTSKKIAEDMQELLREVDTGNTRQAKADSTYYMLKKTEVPTVIIECGFMSNAEDAAKLKEEDYQQDMADIICEGIIASLEELEE